MQASSTESSVVSTDSSKVLNLSTITKDDLENMVQAWGHPKYRADQVWKWIRNQGVTDVELMTNIPKNLRKQLGEYSKPSSLEVAMELKSKDGTIKRAYRCHDGQIIESVLMPYQDGRYGLYIQPSWLCAGVRLLRNRSNGICSPANC